MFDMINIFEVFLPQLLLYPNPSDPLNSEAASLMRRSPKEYEQRIKNLVAKYAHTYPTERELESDNDDDLSSIGDYSDDDDDDGLDMEF